MLRPLRPRAAEGLQEILQPAEIHQGEGGGGRYNVGKTKSLCQDSFNDSNSSDLFHGKKQRRQHSLNRKFYSDYIGLDEKPGLKAIVGKREKIEFAQTVTKYDKKLKVCGIFISNLYLKGYLKSLTHGPYKKEGR